MQHPEEGRKSRGRETRVRGEGTTGKMRGEENRRGEKRGEETRKEENREEENRRSKKESSQITGRTLACCQGNSTPTLLETAHCYWWTEQEPGCDWVNGLRVGGAGDKAVLVIG